MSSTLAKVAFGLVGLLVLLFVRETYTEWDYARRAKKVGAGKAFTILDRPFGIPAVFKLRKANDENRILQYFQDQVGSTGVRTLRHQAAFDMIIFSMEPENVKAVLATQFKDFSLGIRYQQLFPLLGNGIFTLSGDGWKHSRAMLRPQFSREQVSQIETLRDHVNTLLTIFKKKSGNGEFFDAQTEFHHLTMDTATEFLFGESTNSLESSTRKVKGPTRMVSASEFSESFSACLYQLALRTQVGFFYWLIDGPRFRNHVNICHNFVDYFVGKALAKPMQQGEVADRYVFINELTKETRDGTVIRDQAFNILLAGRDTTASLLSFCIYYLSRDKVVWKKLREAVLEEFGTSDETLSFETLKRCTYLSYVVNEILRLHPIVPLNFRTAERDVLLPVGGGEDQKQPLFVPKGTRVVYSAFVLQRLTELWGEDANEFRPERWAEGALHTWDYIPFNGGPRICIGQQFALTETYFTLVRICQTFKDVLYKGDSGYDRLPQWTRLTASVANGVDVSFVVDDKPAA